MKTLERSLGLGAIIAISISSMLGSGIFVMPGLAYQLTGASAWMAYLLAGICVLPAALSKSELATAMPTSGGSYVYLDRTFGPLVGTIAGLGIWVSLLLKSAFALYGIGAYLGVIANVPLVPTTLIILLTIVVLNLYGIGKVSKVLIFVVILSIISLLSMSFYGLTSFDSEMMEPFYKDEFSGLFVTTAMVFVAYAGVTKVAAIAEEIKDPEKNLPRGIMISLLVVMAIYAIVTWVMAGNVPQATLGGNLKPIYVFAESLGGHGLGIVMAIVSIITMASMANAGILAGSRFPFAMSRDFLLPSFLGKLSPRHLTPFWSIIISGAIVADALIFLDIQKIAKLASSFVILVFMFENISVIVLRETRVQWYQPKYKSPFYPWAQLFGIVSAMFLLFTMKSVVLLAVVSVSVPGSLLYLFYSRKKTDRKGVIGIHGARKDLTTTSEELMVPQSIRSIERIHFAESAKVVVPFFGNEKSPEVLVELGAALAGGELVEVTHLTEVPEQLSLSDIRDDNAYIRSLRRRINALSIKQNAAVAFDALVSHDKFKTLYDISQRLHCVWLVTEWGGKTRGAFTLHNPMGWLKNHLKCHLAIFRDAGVRYIRKVMVLAKSDEHDRLIISTADQLAQVHDAEVTIVKVVGEHVNGQEEEAIHMVLETLGENFCKSRYKTMVLRSDELVDSVIMTSVDFDLLVIGDTEKQSLNERFFGNDSDKIIEKATCSVVSVRPCPKF